MKHNKQQVLAFFALAVLGGLTVAACPVQAGGFMTPTANTAGWGRAFGGGSLFKNDPSAAFYIPAAVASIN